MALYAFNCYDKDDNIYSIVAEVEYEDNDWFISYNAAWRNGEIISVVDVNKFNRDNGYQAFNRAIDEATEQGQSEVWIPVTDPHAAHLWPTAKTSTGLFLKTCARLQRKVFVNFKTSQHNGTGSI